MLRTLCPKRRIQMVPIQEVDFHTDKKSSTSCILFLQQELHHFLQRCLFTTLNLIHPLHQRLLFISSFRIPKPRLLMRLVGWMATVKSMVTRSTKSTIHVTVNFYHKLINNNHSKVRAQNQVKVNGA